MNVERQHRRSSGFIGSKIHQEQNTPVGVLQRYRCHFPHHVVEFVFHFWRRKD